MIRVCAALGLLLIASYGLPQHTGSPAGKLHLFVDNSRIESIEGAELRLHEPRRGDIVLTHDAPWEGSTCGYHTVLKDGDIYRMYYRGSTAENKSTSHPQFACYAESSDGIHWQKPSLHQVDFQGSRDNNIFLEGNLAHNFTPFIDANPAATSATRYRALAGTKSTGGIFSFTSADGKRWTQDSDKPVMTLKEFAFDSQNLAFWDTTRGEYRMYFRNWRGGYPNGIRSIQTSTSPDLLNWSEPQWVEFPGAPVEHLYTNSVMPYYRAPELFIGFPSRYFEERGKLVEGLFMSSYDGLNFNRWGEAIIRPGQNSDRWFNRSNYIWNGLVETQSDLPGGGTELSLYSGERYYRGPGVQLRRYTYRVDGFVSVHAPMKGGTVIIKPIHCDGSQLQLNVSTSAGGSAAVELQDESGRPLPGFSIKDCDLIVADVISHTVTWQKRSDLSAYKGRNLRLKINLRDADLYSVRFGN